MKDFYNLNSIVDLTEFPWEEIYMGIPKCKKNASIFYGSIDKKLGLSPEQATWFNSIKHGNPLKGLDILLTNPIRWSDNWYQLESQDFWKPTQDILYFPLLQEWIKNSGIFTGTGRQIFFIQLQHQNSPPHVDENVNNVPNGFSKRREFLWITPAANGKRLLVNGVPTGNITWFDTYQTHETLPEPGVRWSLRIDGNFTNEFKKKITEL